MLALANEGLRVFSAAPRLAARLREVLDRAGDKPSPEQHEQISFWVVSERGRAGGAGTGSRAFQWGGGYYTATAIIQLQVTAVKA